MRLSFVLLVAVAAAFFTGGDAVSANTQSGLAASTKVRSIAAGQTNSKRFLRSDKFADEDEVGVDEERGIITSPIRRDMLSNSDYKRKVFSNWLENNVSSMGAHDYLRLSTKWKQKYHDLYNEYAALHKASGKYP